MDARISIAALAVHAVGLLALSIGQHVRRRRGKLLVGLWAATCALPLLGLLGTIGGLNGAFGAVGSTAASEKAARLAAGISEAMNATALGIGLFVPFLASAIVATVRTARAGRRGTIRGGDEVAGVTV